MLEAAVLLLLFVENKLNIPPKIFKMYFFCSKTYLQPLYKLKLTEFLKIYPSRFTTT